MRILRTLWRAMLDLILGPPEPFEYNGSTTPQDESS